MRDRLIHSKLSELRFEERAPFFEDAVMARLEHRPRRLKTAALGTMAILAVVAGLSFAVPDISPLRVSANAEAHFTVSQADVFNFVLTGQLPVDRSKAEFVQLNSQGDIVSVAPDSQPTRYYAVEGFYRLLNADLASMHHFDSLLETYADQLSDLNLPEHPSAMSAVLFGISNRLTSEMRSLSSGHSGTFADTVAHVFFTNLRGKLIRTEDSLVAAATDSLRGYPMIPANMKASELSNPPRIPIHNVQLPTIPDSIKAVRNRA